MDWHQSTEKIAACIRSADRQQGAADEWFGEPVRLFGAYEEDVLKGKPGEILTYRDGAICRATGDGALWITHLMMKGKPKLPAVEALGDRLKRIPELPLSPFEPYYGRTYRELYYEESGRKGYLHVNFAEGAVGRERSSRLREVLAEIKKRNAQVTLLMGGIEVEGTLALDYWENDQTGRL